MIDIVIVAAGKGSRMEPYTFEKPKCLVPIRGKPLIEHQLDMLKGFAENINDIIIVTGHKDRELRNYFRKTYHGKVHYVYNDIYDKTECGYSMMLGITESKNDVLCIVGDVLFTKDNIMKLMYNRKSCLLVRPPKPTKTGQKVIMRCNKITDIGLGGIHSYDAEAVGPYKLTKLHIKKLIHEYQRLDEDGQRNVHCYSMLGLLCKRYAIDGIWINDDEWLEVDTLEDWKFANLLFDNLLKKSKEL